MDQRTAFRLVVANIPGTWQAAARMCGKAEDTFRHAWSGMDTRYVPSAIDAELVTDFAMSIGTPHCDAWKLAVSSIGSQGQGKGGAKDLPMHAANLLRECSDVVSAVTSALADGSLSANDRKAIRKELLELAEAMKAVDCDVDADEQSRPNIRAV